MVCTNTGGGRLSTQKYPKSSSACSAVDFPAPLKPVTTTSCSVSCPELTPLSESAPLYSALMNGDPFPPCASPALGWNALEVVLNSHWGSGTAAAQFG